MSERQPKMNWWVEQLALWMIANPDRKLMEAATHFGVGVAWISIVKNSDAFKAYYAERMEGLFNKVCGSISDKTAAVTELALDALAEKIATTGSQLPVETLSNVAEMGLKRMGYGATAKTPPPAPAGGNITINGGMVVMDRATLEKARDRMVAYGGASVQQIAEPESSPVPLIEEAK